MIPMMVDFRVLIAGFIMGCLRANMANICPLPLLLTEYRLISPWSLHRCPIMDLASLRSGFRSVMIDAKQEKPRIWGSGNPIPPEHPTQGNAGILPDG
jgi:hypothetical protein